MLDGIKDASLTPTQVAKKLGVHVGTVHRWLYGGVRGRKLNSVLVGGRRRILDRHLCEFLQFSNQVAAKTDESRNKAAQGTLSSFGVRNQSDRSGQ